MAYIPLYLDTEVRYGITGKGQLTHSGVPERKGVDAVNK